MINNEILELRVKQILLNLTCNYKNSGYKLDFVTGNRFLFVPVKFESIEEKNKYSVEIYIDKFEHSCKILNIDEVFDNPYPGYSTIDDNGPSILGISTGGNCYSPNLSKLETATILNSLQDVVTDYEDTHTYKILSISENREINSLDDLQDD